MKRQIKLTNAIRNKIDRSMDIMIENVGSRDRQSFEQFYYQRLFLNNAWFLLENADKIMSDSRMFLCPISVSNNLAYIYLKELSQPSLGAYIEWWRTYNELATDKDGNLIWFISGSPLSGSHACMVVDRAGKTFRLSTHFSFSDIWRSLLEVSKRYYQPTQQCEVYTIEKVLIILKGKQHPKHA